MFTSKGAPWLAFHYYDGEDGGTPKLQLAPLGWTPTAGRNWAPCRNREVKMSFEAYLTNIEKQTGVSPDQFEQLATGNAAYQPRPRRPKSRTG